MLSVILVQNTNTFLTTKYYQSSTNDRVTNTNFINRAGKEIGIAVEMNAVAVPIS